MLVYWFQSVSIGIFTFYKLYSYPIEKINQEMEGGKTLEVNDLAVTNPIAAKIFIAGIILLFFMGLKTLMDVIAHKKKHKQILFAGQDG